MMQLFISISEIINNECNNNPKEEDRQCEKQETSPENGLTRQIAYSAKTPSARWMWHRNLYKWLGLYCDSYLLVEVDKEPLMVR